MCGIAGFCDPTQLLPSQDWPAVIDMMGQSIRRRGPDGSHTWISSQLGLALTHRRLAILDLSDRAQQPMLSLDGRFVIAFNGEIYNHKALRRWLPDVPWRTTSDTESLVEAFAHHGVEATLSRVRGMFAIALIDRVDRLLYLMRDRIGEKPLCYSWIQGPQSRAAIVFSSQVDTLNRHPLFSPKLSSAGVRSFALQGYISGPGTVYENVHKVPPGCCLRFDIGSKHLEMPEEIQYWSVTETLRQSGLSSGNTDRGFIDERLEQLLQSAVHSQTLADVPLGAFLSGGIDSSLVTAQLRKATAGPLHTFSIGFTDPRHDESSQARAVAQHLGTTHHEMIIDDGHVQGLVDLLPHAWDEPFADSSQIPMLALVRHARQHVTVALSGDAGDELFAGYDRYRLVRRLWGLLRFAPVAIRRGIQQLDRTRFTVLISALASCNAVPPSARAGLEWFRRSLPHLGCPTRAALYGSLTTSMRCAALLTTQVESSHNHYAHEHDDFLRGMMTTDLVNYLPGDILVKVDRAAMAYGMETRIPFLDHDLVTFALSIPSNELADRCHGKLPLRRLLAKSIPEHLLRHPKKGFSVPLAAWLRGPLREWADAVICGGIVERADVFSAPAVRQLWHEHVSGTRNNQTELWRVLMFHQWFERQAGTHSRISCAAA